MPRIRLTQFPAGLVVNTPLNAQPQGSLRCARNAASLAGGGTLRSRGPFISFGKNTARSRAFTRFNGRMITYGEVTSPPSSLRIDRETAPDSNFFTTLDHTTLTNPTVTLPSGSKAPALFLTASPTPERDEQLFILDPANTPGNNALLKLDDSGNLTHWGILPPKATDVTTINLTTVNGLYGVGGGTNTKYISDNPSPADPFSDGEPIGGPLTKWVLTSGDEDGLSPATTAFLDASVAPSGHPLKCIVAKGDTAVLTRTFATAVDLTSVGTASSTDEDFIQFWVRIRRPAHIKSLEIAFDTSASANFTSSFFSREITFRLVNQQQRHKLIGLGDMLPANPKKLQKFLQKQEQKAPDLTFAEQHGQQRIPIAANTWTRITLPKNTFIASGQNPSWNAVTAVRITIHASQEGKTAVFLDALTLAGGPGLHGDYQYTLTFANDDGTPATPGTRSNPPIDDANGSATGIPNSIVSVRIANVERQTVRLTLPAMTFDPQVKRIEIWRTVGNGSAFFRCGYITVSGGSIPQTTYDDNCADYYGLRSDANPTTTAGGNGVNFAVLDATVELPLDNTSPNDPGFAFQDVANTTHLGRMWWGRNVAALRDDGTSQASLGNQGNVYYSPPGRLEAVQGFIPVTSGVTDPVQKLVVWNGRLFCFTTSGLFEIVGTDEPFVALRVEGAPGTLTPYTVQPTPIGIMWLAEDGVYVFNGMSARNVTDAALLPLFRERRSIDTGGTTPLAPVHGPTQRAVAGRYEYVIGPGEDISSTQSYIFDFESQTWRGPIDEGPKPPAVQFGGAFYDATRGQLLVDNAAAGGQAIGELDPKTYPTTGIVAFFDSVVFLWRASPGRKGILRKVWVDLTVGTNGSLGSLAVTAITDNGQTAFSTISAGFNVGDTNRNVFEFNANFPGEVFALRVSCNSARNVTINAIEADIYDPAASDQAV